MDDLPRSPVHTFLAGAVTELEKVCKPVQGLPETEREEARAEHNRAIGALAVMLGMTAAELGRDDLHLRALKAIGVKP
jgi:hypothetical protein